MFNSSPKNSNDSGKIEEKISQDFVTHNMPESHRFSGQTFTDKSAVSNNAKPVNIPNVADHHKIGILIIGGGLIFIGVLFYLGYSYLIKPYLTPVIPEAPKVITETPLEKIPEIEEQPTIKTETIATSEPVISTSTVEQASSTEELLPEERPIVSAPIASTTDSDTDGLSDDEERIAGTDPNKADTDNDGYLDLAEIKSGYDPLDPGKKMSSSSFLAAYQIDSKASLIYPSSWEVTRSEANNTVIFADSDKAFIQINYQDNSENLNPTAWFAEEFPGQMLGESISGQGWQGFYSQDGLAAYIFSTNSAKVYSVVCSPLTSDTESVTLFRLMLKSLIIR